jgi:uncharacterized protein DUF6502
MQEEQRRKVLNSFQLVLRPIVKILLRYGIGFSEFAESLKTVYVDIGSSEFGIRGRPTNISRVAVMTGLTRKEVRRLRTKIEGGADTVVVKSTPITEILRRWHSEDEFLDSQGRPTTLPFSGDVGSFSSLVKRFGGDVPAGAMRTELQRVGSVEVNDKGELSVKLRSFWPSDQTGKLESALVHHVYPLLSTVAHNTDSENETMADAQYAAYSVNIRSEDKPRVRRMCADRLPNIAESFDDLFIAYETRGDAPSPGTGAPVMVGLYYFEERDENAKYDW